MSVNYIVDTQSITASALVKKPYPLNSGWP